MKEEKEMGITKSHIGFIAEEVEESIPEKVENILVEVDGIKKLSYIKLNSILWGAVREQQQKIEHLETRLFEVENFIKDASAEASRGSRDFVKTKNLKQKQNLKFKHFISCIYYKGSKQSTVKHTCMEEINNINEDELDISKIDKLQIKAIKEMSEKIKEIEDKKSDRIMYKLPAINLCSYSLI